MEKLEKSLSELRDELSSKLLDVSRVKESVSQSVDEEISLRRERARRRKNVMVFGLRESSPPSRENDRKSVGKMFGALEVPVRNFRVFRIGKPVPGKDRPLLVDVNGVWERNLLLARASRLSVLNEFKCVFVRPDLPPENRGRRPQGVVRSVPLPPISSFDSSPRSAVPPCYAVPSLLSLPFPLSVVPSLSVPAMSLPLASPRTSFSVPAVSLPLASASASLSVPAVSLPLASASASLSVPAVSLPLASASASLSFPAVSSSCLCASFLIGRGGEGRCWCDSDPVLQRGCTHGGQMG